MQDTFARATHSAARPSARATIGYLVYNTGACSAATPIFDIYFAGPIMQNHRNMPKTLNWDALLEAKLVSMNFIHMGQKNARVISQNSMPIFYVSYSSLSVGRLCLLRASSVNISFEMWILDTKANKLPKRYKNCSYLGSR